MSALTDLFTSLANKIRSKLGTTSKYTPAQAISAIDDVYNKGVADGATPTQEKTATAGTSAITVTPDSGYALSKVTVNPTPSQTKSATPSTSAQTISPDSGKLLSSVSISAISTQTKSVTPSTSAQTVTPDSGKYLTSVSVGAISTQTKTTTPTTRSATAATVTPDSGKYLTSVTVNTNSVPNTNSGTYTYTSGSTGGTVDMGASNTYRYVNAANVYQTGRKSVALNGMYLRIENVSGGSGVSVSPSYISAAKSIIIKVSSKSANFTSGYDLIDLYDSNGNNQAFNLSNCTALNTDYTFQFSDDKTIWIVKFHINKPNDITLYYRWTF